MIRNATIAKMPYLNKSIGQFSYEGDETGFKFILYRSKIQRGIPVVTLDVTLDVTLNATEMTVLGLLQQKPAFSRSEIADKIKTVRTVQRALDSLLDKGYIQRIGSKQEPKWTIPMDV